MTVLGSGERPVIDAPTRGAANGPSHEPERAAAGGPVVAVVIPTIGRPALQRLLTTLADQGGWHPAEVVVVDDRGAPASPRGRASPLAQAPPTLDLTEAAASLGCPLRVVRSFGRGPAAARNLGWQITGAPWVAFIDDDVALPCGWAALLVSDLAACPPDVGGSQGRLHVPLPTDRAPTDSERGTEGLERAAWATADMAYRRAALVAVAGFDERFPRARREDADLALRVRVAGWSLVVGQRTTVHPVRPVDDRVSLRVQRDDADDALMSALHGASWRAATHAPPGRLRWHVATVVAAVIAVLTAASGRRRAAATGAIAWAVLTGDLARRRIAPGPRGAAEVSAMIATSAAIPPAAVVHRVRGWWRSRRAASWPVPVRAVLFDRDGTLVHDVPYNGDPTLVEPVPGARAAVDRLRRAGVRIGVITNQSGIGRGLITRDQAAAVNAAVDAAVGPFATWQVCPHAPHAGCACRKPAPGMVRAAASALGVPPSQVAVIGDIGADVEAARAAGARAVLVPTPATLRQDVDDAPVVAADLAEAVDLLLGVAS